MAVGPFPRESAGTTLAHSEEQHMAHFIASIHGSRGPASRLGTKASGIDSHTRGWNAGVRVSGRYNEYTQTDEFDVFLTGGSSGHEDIHVATVKSGRDGKLVTSGDSNGAMDAIAELLDGREWNVADLETIAELVRGTSRVIRDIQ